MYLEVTYVESVKWIFSPRGMLPWIVRNKEKGLVGRRKSSAICQAEELGQVADA